MQLNLPMLSYYEGPKIVGPDVVAQCKTYRDAVRKCFELRTRTRMSLSVLAEESGCYASHMSDYVSSNPEKRELPAKHIADFEVACGNRLVTQWLAAQAHVTILETFIQARAA